MKMSFFSSILAMFTATASAFPAKNYSYDDIKALSDSIVAGTCPSDTVLIDVREPNEYNAGFIPGAKNMPLRSVSFALCKEDAEFEQLLGFPKPAKDMHVVIYCQSGMRAKTADSQAEHCGYENRGIYLGSWAEWSSKQ